MSSVTTPAAAPPRRVAALVRLRNVAIAALVPTLALVLWWVLSSGSTSPFYPPLSTILDTFRETWLFDRFGSDIVPSMRRMLIGYGIAAVVGIGVGTLLGRIATARRATQPLVDFWRAVPATALFAPAIVLFGIGDGMKIGLIAFVCCFPILTSTMDGVRALHPTLDDVARSFRLSRRQRFFQLLFPAAGPQIFSGLRIALSFAFILMIVSEMIAATNGIGFVTINAQQQFQTDTMWSGMLLLGLLGATLNAVFLLIERRVLGWHYGMRAKQNG